MENEIKRLDQRIDYFLDKFERKTKALDQRIDYIFEIFDKRTKEIMDFIENQFYGLLKNRIIAYAKEHNGLTEQDIRENIAFKKHNGEVNYLDSYLLYSTFLFMKKNKQFNEVHRGKGRPIIYKVRETNE
jgi:hypothetical protein